MSRRVKGAVFLAALAALLSTLLLGRWALAGAVFAAAFAWLLWETRERRRFSFVAERRCPETRLDLGAEALGLAVSSTAPWALLLQAGPQAVWLDLLGARLHGRAAFSAPPLALLARPDGGLLWASEDRLHWSDAQGVELGSLAFEAPLYRQSYRLLLSPDGRHAALHTPWFVQSFEPDLSALGPRLRYEDAGHFLKYAALSADGRRLYAAGALLLDPEEGGAGMEARWDAWDREDGGWRHAWRKAGEGYDNSHLRGISLSADDRVLCVELWQGGYETQLFGRDGERLAKRMAEHPVLSPDGSLMAWEPAFDAVAVGGLREGAARYRQSFGERIRLKALQDDGSCLLLAGRRLCVLGPDGALRWEAWFKNDPQHLGLGPEGALAVVAGAQAGVLRLPWPPA